MNTRTKIWDTPTGYPMFFMPVGLEPQVRVWPRARAPPVADAARAQRVQRSVFSEERQRREKIPGTANGHRHHNTYPYLIQSHQIRVGIYIPLVF